MSRAGFDFQPELTGATLALRPLRPDDLDGLYAAGADPAVWAGHPAKDRHERSVFEPYVRFLLERGGALTIVDRASGAIIGCSRYYTPPDRPEGIAIGFTFLNNAYWGGDTNRALKRLMLAHAFATVPEVWFHIAPTNIRSQRATAKLGAEHAYDATLDLSGTPAPWMCFRLTRDAWSKACGREGSGGL